MLEQLYSAKFLKEKPIYAFLLGVAYSVIAIGASIILFPKDPALVSVLIISVLFLPSLYKLSVMEEKEELKEKGFLKAIYNQKQFIKVYFYAFFGMLIVFAFFSAILPSLATNTISNISVVTIETGQNVTKFYNFTTNQTGNFTGNQSGNQT